MLSFTHHATVFLSSVYIGIYMDCITICCYLCVYSRTNEGIGMYACKDQKETPCHLPVCLSSLLLYGWMRLVTMNFSKEETRKNDFWSSPSFYRWCSRFLLCLFFFLGCFFYYNLISLYCQSKNRYSYYYSNDHYDVCLVDVR
jgi:hypothetical protein